MILLTTDEETWMKAARTAFAAIEAASQSTPDDAQTRDIHHLASTLHSIGLIRDGNSLFADLHTPIELSKIERVSQRLLDSVRHAEPASPPSIESLAPSKR